MRKDRLLTSFVLDEITAQARYRNLLDAAAQHRLCKIARATQPNARERRWLALRNSVLAWGRWLNAHTLSLARGK